MVNVPKWLRGRNGTLVLRSAAGSDTGHVRTHNEDAFLDMPQRMMWAVADGMGGHADGAIASKEIVASLSGIAPSAKLNASSGQIANSILSTNDRLRAMAKERGDQTVIGSTVVAACARADKMAFLWAGDSRAYRLRANRLEQLTHDHDLENELTRFNISQNVLGGEHRPNMVSRAVGAHDKLDLEEVRVTIQPGDSFMLCSDGLYREVPDDKIQTLLLETDPARACARLLDAALMAGARDNVTVIVINAKKG